MHSRCTRKMFAFYKFSTCGNFNTCKLNGMKALCYVKTFSVFFFKDFNIIYLGSVLGSITTVDCSLLIKLLRRFLIQSIGKTQNCTYYNPVTDQRTIQIGSQITDFKIL